MLLKWLALNETGQAVGVADLSYIWMQNLLWKEEILMENTQVRAKHFHGMHNFPLDLACTAPGLKDSGIYMDPTLDVARKKKTSEIFYFFNTQGI